MKVETIDGISIDTLPPYAKCKRTGLHPFIVDACPRGERACFPEMCDAYEEDYEKAAESAFKINGVPMFAPLDQMMPVTEDLNCGLDLLKKAGEEDEQ